MIPATGYRGILQERCGKVTGSFRTTPEIAGKWKQYSDRKLSGFFPVDSCQLPVLSGRNWQFPDRVVRPGIGSVSCISRYLLKIKTLLLKYFRNVKD